MEAMGIQIQEVLNEAQTAQNDMLEKVRTNMRKIEELKAQQSKLERDIKIFQGKANELSETIDLFILSSQSNG
jgi:peptidoglycan hydrolase CwlO-like protein